MDMNISMRDKKILLMFLGLGIFAGGVAFGSVGLKLLGSKDAKKVYAQVTAATLRAKESVMKTVTNVKENAGDILADAKDINEKRDAKNAVIEDECDCDCGCEAVSEEA